MGEKLEHAGAKPIPFDPKKETVDEFSRRIPVWQVVDRYAELLEELFLIRNPKYRFDKNYKDEFKKFAAAHADKNSLEEVGRWFYFPWNRLLVHYLEEELHQELRTARNKNIITASEQKKFYDCAVGIGGLSVGSHAALTLAMMGGAKKIKLADPDTISGSNLNRIRTDFTQVGAGKCDSVVHQIYQINPYAEVHAYPEGITLENMGEFMDGLDVLVDELDNPELKIRLRLEARKRGIPVIMATDNGDNVIFDIERYDLDKNLMLFSGAAGDLTLEKFKSFKPQELPRLATQIAGPHVVVPRMLESVFEVGKSLYSWPQLGDAATLAGVSVAYVVKRLALGEPLRSGKLEVNLDSIFDPNYNSSDAVADRESRRKNILKNIGL